VFLATSIVQLDFLARLLLVADASSRLPGLWMIIVAFALLGVALAGSDRLLVLASAAIGVVGGFIYAAGTGDPGVLHQAWPDTWIAVLGALLGVAGIIAYRLERAAS
jgi:hypothetical protein